MYIETDYPSPAINGTVPVLQNNSHWYAIYTRSRFEKKVHRELQQSKFQVFLPLIQERKVWSDRIKTVSMPLFPSYVFVKLERQNIPKIFYHPGIVHVVSSEGKPCEVRDDEIILLEKIMSHGFPVQKVVNCMVGDKVRVVRGPLKGWAGKVETTRGTSRIVFQLTSILQSISVEVGMEDLEKVG